MTYGLRVVNTTLKTQIDSTYQMFGMAVKSTGVGNTITGIDYYNDQIMIATPSLGDGQQRYIVASWNSDRSTVTFRNGNHNVAGQEFPLTPVTYIHMTQARLVGSVNFPENYGLKIKAPDGRVAFDSRALTLGVIPVFMFVHPTLSLTPYSNGLKGSGDYGDDLIVSNLTDYVSIMHGAVGLPGDAPVYPTLTQGVRFTNNRLDTITNQYRTGAFYENLIP